MRHDEVLQKARETVGRHPVPDFVTGFHVQLGEDFYGDPVVQVVFDVLPAAARQTMVDMRRRGNAMNALEDDVLTDLLKTFEDRSAIISFKAEGAPFG